MKVWGAEDDFVNDGKWDDISCETMKTGNFSLDSTIGYICEAAGEINPILISSLIRLQHDLHK